MRVQTSVAGLMVLLYLIPAQADEWTLRKQDAELGVTVRDRVTPEGYREFHGATEVQSRLSALVALFRDTERMPEWLYRTKHVETLNWVNDMEAYTHASIALPWPFSDRDAVLHATLSQDPETLAITLEASAVPGYIPEIDHSVRMPVVDSTWRFTPRSDRRVAVEFRGYADPGGQLSHGLLNRFQSRLVWQSPYRSLQALHEIIAEPGYQAAVLPQIKEPPLNTAPPSAPLKAR